MTILIGFSILMELKKMKFGIINLLYVGFDTLLKLKKKKKSKQPPSHCFEGLWNKNKNKRFF